MGRLSKELQPFSNESEHSNGLGLEITLRDDAILFLERRSFHQADWIHSRLLLLFSVGLLQQSSTVGNVMMKGSNDAGGDDCSDEKGGIVSQHPFKNNIIHIRWVPGRSSYEYPSKSDEWT